MSREYGVEKCACGACKLVRDHSSLPWEWAAWGARKLNYCPSCGTRVGIDERGPWREQMVPRAALEWLAKQMPDCPAVLDRRDAEGNVVCFGECVDCWLQAALKLAEDGSNE